MNRNATLIIFGGLPGTGKTTLAKALAEQLQAVYIRIDTIEQRLKNLEAMKIGNEGYLVAYDIAADNLRAGNIVIADSVNSIAITRAAWKDVAVQNQAEAHEIEIICSDKEEHKKRVEMRRADIKGHKMPTWQEVMDREYEAWETKDLAIDTAHKTPEQVLAILTGRLGVI